MTYHYPRASNPLNNSLQHYSAAFSKLNRGYVSGQRAPHKPVLLLAVIDSIEAGEVFENRIYSTPELVARFKDVWSRYVDSEVFSPNFTNPFYHLTGDRFWHLQTRTSEAARLTSSRSPKSFSGLQAWVEYAYLDEPLFKLLVQPDTREVLRAVLLQMYFFGKSGAQTGYIATVEQQILHENSVVYRQLAIGLDEEEVISRSAVFKRVVPRVYNYTCCVSGMRLISTTSVQMVDACHIVPFAESYDDTIANGLSLCPNLHRAFDRGLFRIDEEYRVRLSGVFTEAECLYTLRSFEGKPILLPEQKHWWPGKDNLAAHSERWQSNF